MKRSSPQPQVAQTGAEGFNHLGDMQATLRAVIDREAALNKALTDLAGTNPGIAIRVRNILGPLLRQSAEYRSVMIQTEKAAADLATTDGTRLSRVVFG